jgi:hypothetical protein
VTTGEVEEKAGSGLAQAQVIEAKERHALKVGCA